MHRRLIICWLLIAMLITIAPLNAMATPVELDRINSFSQTLTYKQYNALRTGNITVEQKTTCGIISLKRKNTMCS